MLIILGFQLLLSALGEDVRNVPQRPLCGGSLPEDDIDDGLSDIDLPRTRRDETLAI
jgi:hypothetical protein